MVNHMRKIYNGLPFTKHFSFVRNKDGPFLDVTLNFWTNVPKGEEYGETVIRDVTRFSLVDLPHYTAFHPKITQIISMFEILTIGVQFFIWFFKYVVV
jgi:hypothetical protein